MNSENISSLLISESLFSELVWKVSREINVYSILLVILIGIIGHLLTMLVYSKRKFRTSSSHVYMLSLALNDALFLIIHLFEDTIRTYRDMISPNTIDFLELFNIIDKFNFACRFINYFRYVLRFNSAYIIVAFTIQRLILILKPVNLTRKNSPLKLVLCIVLISFSINIWVLYMFKLYPQTKSDETHCDVNRHYANLYFKITIVYVIILIWIPTLVIFLCNFLVIYRVKKSRSIKKKFCIKYTAEQKSANYNTTNKTATLSVVTAIQKTLSISNFNSSFRRQKMNELIEKEREKEEFTINQMAKMVHNSHTNNMRRVTRLLILVSFAYALLNLPYLVCWSLFYYKIIILKKSSHNTTNYIFASLQFAEVFYVTSFSINFFIYSIAVSKFRRNLRNTILRKKPNNRFK